MKKGVSKSSRNRNAILLVIVVLIVLLIIYSVNSSNKRGDSDEGLFGGLFSVSGDGSLRDCEAERYNCELLLESDIDSCLSDCGLYGDIGISCEEYCGGIVDVCEVEFGNCEGDEFFVGFEGDDTFEGEDPYSGEIVPFEYKSEGDWLNLNFFDGGKTYVVGSVVIIGTKEEALCPPLYERNKDVPAFFFIKSIDAYFIEDEPKNLIPNVGSLDEKIIIDDTGIKDIEFIRYSEQGGDLLYQVDISNIYLKSEFNANYPIFKIYLADSLFIDEENSYITFNDGYCIKKEVNEEEVKISGNNKNRCEFTKKNCVENEKAEAFECRIDCEVDIGQSDEDITLCKSDCNNLAKENIKNYCEPNLESCLDINSKKNGPNHEFRCNQAKIACKNKAVIKKDDADILCKQDKDIDTNEKLNDCFTKNFKVWEREDKVCEKNYYDRDSSLGCLDQIDECLNVNDICTFRKPLEYQKCDINSITDGILTGIDIFTMDPICGSKENGVLFCEYSEETGYLTGKEDCNEGSDECFVRNCIASRTVDVFPTAWCRYNKDKSIAPEGACTMNEKDDGICKKIDGAKFTGYGGEPYFYQCVLKEEKSFWDLFDVFGF